MSNTAQLDQFVMAPHSREAEEAVIGCILINGDLFSAVSDLRADDFFFLQNHYVWEAMTRLHERDEPIEYLTVLEELRTQERLDMIGGSAYVTLLSSYAHNSYNAPTYAALVARTAIRRRLMDAAEDISNLALSEDRNIHEITSQTQQIINGVISSVRTPEPTMEDISDRRRQLLRSEEGYDWILTPLTEQLGQLSQGKLIVIAGRTGMGKTRFTVQQALQFARAAKRVLFMTTEMADFEIQAVFIEMMSRTGITYETMKTGSTDKHPVQSAELVCLEAELEQSALTILPITGWAVEQVAARINREPAGYYDLVIVDSISRLGKSSGFYSDHAEIGNRSLMLKNAAQEAQTCIIAPSQFNRENASGDQGTENLAGSDATGHEADLVLGIKRPDPEGKPGRVQLRIVKRRFGGGVGKTIELGWNTVKGMYGLPDEYHNDDDAPDDGVYRGGS